VVSRSLDLRPTDRCVSAPALVVTCASADQRRRSALAEVAEVVVAGDDDVDLPAALDALAERGLVRVLCEGGPALLTALVRAGRVDELCLTVSPRLLGTAPTLLTEALAEPVDLRLQHLVDGDDGSLLARYAVERSDRGRRQTWDVSSWRGSGGGTSAGRGPARRVTRSAIATETPPSARPAMSSTT
jgi:riboflavin biosynthesis pyrimidine reductase